MMQRDWLRLLRKELANKIVLGRQKEIPLVRLCLESAFKTHIAALLLHGTLILFIVAMYWFRPMPSMRTPSAAVKFGSESYDFSRNLRFSRFC